MSCSGSRFVNALVLWTLCTGASLAQPIRLKLKPDRMQHAKEIEQKARASKDSLLLAEAWYLYGKTYVFAGDYSTAQNYFLKSLRIQEAHGESYELARLYIRLSETEGRLGHFKTALQDANTALQVARRIQSDRGQMNAYGALARVYEGIWTGRSKGKRTDYERILAFYKKRESLGYKLNDTLGIAEASVEIGTLFTRVNDLRAIPYLERGVYLLTLLNKDGTRINALLQLTAAYLMAHKTHLALRTLQEAEKLYGIKKVDEFDIHLALERNYVLYFRTTGQWKQAFSHLRTLNELERSQLLADNEGSISRLNIEYETEKKQAQLNVQSKELALRTENLRTQRQFTAAASTLLVMAVGMSFVFFRLSRKNQRISRQNEELVKEQNHRVKNNLQVVSSLLSLQSKRLTDEAAKKAVEESRLRVESMAILHRRLYDGDKFARVNVDEFIRELVGVVLKSYGCCEVNTVFTIDNTDLSADKAVPLGLILNELTTNACKYAFTHTKDPQLSITCHRKNNKIELTVADNGPGLDGPGLDGPGVSDNDQLDEQSGETNEDRNSVYTQRSSTFGMQLIEAQVDQLRGTSEFISMKTTAGPGTLFVLKFNA